MAKKDHHDFDSWGERVETTSFAETREIREPVVFNFRPNEILVVDTEHKEDWKKLFEEHVDVPVAELRHQWTGSPLETVSGCNDIGWDDCDQW
jgi:hypothetical protein